MNKNSSQNIYTVTFHRANNYGAMLQAYALQKYLLDKNYNTEILDYDNRAISDGYKLFSNQSNSIIKNAYHKLRDIPFIYRSKRKIDNFDNFREKLKLSNYFCDKNKFIKKYYKNAIYIVGSDQIWNPRWTNGIDDIYTLNFGNNDIKRISYAASSGGVQPLKDNKIEFLKRLNKFDYISVRESSMKEYLSTITNKPIEVVLDPTLLLTKNDWIKFAGKDRLIKEKYIFTYEAGNPTQEYYDTINKLANTTGLKVVYFGKHDLRKKYKCKKKSCYSAGPVEWVNLLLNAEYVVTTSFHGTALSTILNKNMFVVLSTLPDRLTTLLNITKQNDRIVKNLDDVDRIFNLNTDWDEVNKLLNIERKKSSEWLLNAIESVENE